MLNLIEKRDDLEKLDELVSLQSQVKASRLQDKLGKQNVHVDMQKVIEPVNEAFKYVSQDVTKSMTDGSEENRKALSN